MRPHTEKPPKRRAVRYAAVGFSVLLLTAGPAGTAGAQAYKNSMPGHSGGAGMRHGHKGDVVPCTHTMPAKHVKPPPGASTGKIVIQSPANGGVVRSRTVKVIFDVRNKGVLDDHIHIYLDGRCQNMIRQGGSYHISGLRDGKHTIELRLVTREHVEYGPKARVDIVVRHK